MTDPVFPATTRGRLSATPGRRIRHHFTVDVEEYFQVGALEPYSPRNSWSARQNRVEIGVRHILRLLASHDARGTFFVLSWVAERSRDLIREIADEGHEIASHGSDHRRVTTLSPIEFRESVRTSKGLLEDVSGRPVFGYRAPNFSILRGMEWALDILGEEGYRYDSSLFPVRRNGSGYVGGQRDPHTLRLTSGVLDEIPPATLRLWGKLLPAGGGAYFRHLPYAFVHSAFVDAERRGVPGTFYIHPWELDPDQPRFAVPFLTGLRHYGGLKRTAPRLERLLSAFSFQPIASTLGFTEHSPPLVASASVSSAVVVR